MLKATEKVERLIAMVPWIMQNGGATLDELSKRFDYPSDTLFNDLTKILFYVGPAPHDPGNLIEVFASDDFIEISNAEFLSRPPSLTIDEGFVLLVKAQMYTEVFNGGHLEKPLASALRKLSSAINADSSAVSVDMGVRKGATYKTVKSALQSNKKLKISYYSFNTDKNTERVIHPSEMFHNDRYIYLEAYCETASEYRTFRIDRITDATEMNEDVNEDFVNLKNGSTFREFSFPREAIVTLSINSKDDWIVAKYPTNKVVVGSQGNLFVTLPVTSLKWLERLLLRLDPATEIVEAPEWIPKETGRNIALRILKRYNK
ncbi:MAG: WYL domain-containing protein [Actinomycetota bacterium]|nr:WYL domain-containing protein [Actinomycetota bacterium]